ncbi:hypothetical protein JN11_02395 [Mucilaginibacter frigoritolerans]|uniref:Lipoprotein n=1 Tax=Mucilaginibacter frigoritolerans TaxID=652788 RepID=A0A562U2E6_9SPHI|nr:hypothetical protein [Mucilaginibacter frigoritolerans]TWI99979.1 hypothetical protein JN11_02395 [Mucilaginibacter frigoritolerans]
MSYRSFLYIGILFWTCLVISCKKKKNVTTAFYYWKSNFNLNVQQGDILKQTAHNTLYLRFFDVSWNDHYHNAFPNAIVNFSQQTNGLQITPVIFVTNKTFENIRSEAIDSLAIHCNALVNHIAQKQKINYKNIQIDCDWTLSTRDKYFSFLKSFKKINQHFLEATIRLHQVKYKETTGIPPIDKGILMFYNMGKVNANLQQPNSIYNNADAQKYISYIPQYPLQLDVALALFSWSVQIRDGKVIQIYGNIGEKELSNPINFKQSGNAYCAKKSFFLNGIYIKENDNFKLEKIDLNMLTMAVKQLIPYLPPQKNRTIIYYELANLNLSKFNTQTLSQISADF